MRAALSLAVFAASALAVPYNKRDVVTNVVYATEVVTVTAGQQPPAQNTAPVYSHAPEHKHHHAHQQYHRPQQYSAPVEQKAAAPTSAPAPSYQPAPSSQAEQPKPKPQSTQQAPASQPAQSNSKPTGYQEITVYHHNIHRANHSAPDLEWDQGLANTAQKIAESCVYAHNTEEDGGGYGQNIAAGVESNNISAIITDLFYNGEEPYFSGLYGQDNPDMSLFENWGHFSQIVWKDTTHVGCYTQHCPGGLANVGGDVSPYFTVCNYKSPGNFAGEYGSNVLKPLGEPTVSWSAGGL